MEWASAQANLRELHAQAKESGATVGFVIFPILAQLDLNYPFQRITDLLQSFGTQEGMSVHNLLPAFMGRNGPELWNSAYDQHPNELAHQIAAESLLPFVMKLLAEHETGS
jgi:hypothetical protein